MEQKNKMNIFFTSYATLDTRLMWHLCRALEKYGSSWQSPSSPRVATAGSNWQWKILAPAKTTFQFEKCSTPSSRRTRGPNFHIPRWQWVREILRPQRISAFWVNLPSTLAPTLGYQLSYRLSFGFSFSFSPTLAGWQTSWHAIYHFSSKDCWWPP